MHASRRPTSARGLSPAAERIGLNALAGAACELGISRERLSSSIAGEAGPPAASPTTERNEAFRDRACARRSTRRSEAGRIGAAEAFILRGAIEIAPVDALLDRVFGET